MQIGSAGVEWITDAVLDHEEQYVALPLEVFLEDSSGHLPMKISVAAPSLPGTVALSW